MSLPSQSRSKKRKQAAITEAGEEVAQPALKKPKRLPEKPKNDKPRVGPLTSTGRGASSGSKGEFQTITSTLNVSIPPIYAMEPRRGVQEMLDGMLMRYVPALTGVLVAHTNVKFLGTVATIKADCPFSNCCISFDATVWSPQIGMKLLGKVNLCSPDHVSLLVHNVFNVSIPRHHIPSESWEFEYGPAENDPEVAAEGPITKGDPMDRDMKMAEQTPHEPNNPETSTPSGGRWVRSLTGDTIGGKSGYIEFTVIGLTMANQMVSVIGSIQPDPFSPEHVPKTAALTSTESEEADEVLNQLVAEPIAVDDLEEDSDEEDDTFRRLGKMADKAKRAELKAREEAEAAAAAAKAAKKDKKKKSKKRPAEENITQKKAKKAKRKKVE